MGGLFYHLFHLHRVIHGKALPHRGYLFVEKKIPSPFAP